MSKAKAGDTVKVHYNGTLEDGSTFDTTAGKEPFEMTLGKREVIPGFEQAVEGMSVGEKQEVTLKPAEAYGDYQNEAVIDIPRSRLPEEIDPEVDMVLQAKDPEGQVTHMTITKVTDDNVTLDGNHPLAGKKLKFEIELVSIG